MVKVFIPPDLRELTDGQEVVEADGQTVRRVINDLEKKHPGVKARLCDGDELAAGLSVTVNSAISPLGLLQRVEAEDEIHFLPAIGGG